MSLEVPHPPSFCVAIQLSPRPLAQSTTPGEYLQCSHAAAALFPWSHSFKSALAYLLFCLALGCLTTIFMPLTKRSTCQTSFAELRLLSAFYRSTGYDHRLPLPCGQRRRLPWSLGY